MAGCTASLSTAIEVMPLWQAYTPTFLRVNCYLPPGGSVTCTGPFPTGGTI